MSNPRTSLRLARNHADHRTRATDQGHGARGNPQANPRGGSIPSAGAIPRVTTSIKERPVSSPHVQALAPAPRVVVPAGTTAGTAVRDAGLSGKGPDAVVVVRDPEGRLRDLAWA